MARLLIDGYNLGLRKGTGVATYGRNLCREASAVGHEVWALYGQRFGDSGNPLLREIAFFDQVEKQPHAVPRALRTIQQAVSGPLGHSPQEVRLSGSVISRPFEARLPQCSRVYNGMSLYSASAASFALWGQLAKVRMPERPDLAHWTYPLPVRSPGCANIYTLHDLVPLRLPYTTLDNKKRYLKLLQRIARTADRIVTVSECSKRDIVEILGVAEDRVTNTYQSVSIPDALMHRDEADVIREVEGATGAGYKDYFLFWGSIEPKKNIERMIEAYLASGIGRPLVIVGAQAWKSEDQLRMLKNESLRSEKRIIQLSYAPFSQLVSLIRGARAALFPSLYEGFGLPVLEAMLLGTPVICSNTASLPEVAGDAALSVDPHDSQALASAIREMDSDADLRDALSRHGLAQARLFSPASYRERLNELYRQLL
jgi:glycosyltransferase involved in cell wall biosynthesis